MIVVLFVFIKRESIRAEFILSGKRCATPDLSPEKMMEVEARLSSIPQPSGMAALATVKINVYWHTITTTTGAGALSMSAINSQINVLNNDYGSTGFKFFLKTADTTKNDAWSNCDYGSAAETQMKNRLRKGSSKDLNIYSIANNEGILGWATFPVDAKSNLKRDGVVLDFRTLPGGAAAPYNEGATATHEVGHWMGLYHTFQGGCAVDVNQGDVVSDTPAVREANYGCPADTTNSCPGTTGGLSGNDHCLVGYYLPCVSIDTEIMHCLGHILHITVYIILCTMAQTLFSRCAFSYCCTTGTTLFVLNIGTKLSFSALVE